MGLHKLTAGDGYTYLTRQVAAGDGTERGYTSLGDYYSAKGEAPGVWAGPGAVVLGVAGGQVSEAQMRNLFGLGVHPDAQRIRQDKIGQGCSVPAAEKATLLGARFPVFEGDQKWRSGLAERYAAYNKVRGLPENRAVPEAERSRIRTETAREMFTDKHGRAPAGTQELDGFLRQVCRPQSSAIAGYDLTFTPVKSISTLWAIAPIEMSAAIEDAHHAAVAMTLDWLGRCVAYTRLGAGGVAQVDTDGLTFALFTHRDSRAGDPDLHTHVAVSNKVRVAGTTDRWLALDGRMIHRYTVAASEVYNTVLEAEVTARIGGRFTERDNPAGKRPVRELVGVNPQLNQRWSTRRAAITGHRKQLVAGFLAAHGRLPTAVELISLSEQATLATRQAKHEPRSLGEQRHVWHTEAAAVLGGADGLGRMLEDVAAGRDPGSPTGPARPPGPRPTGPPSPGEVTAMAGATVAVVAQCRALWSAHNLAAEAARQVRRRGGLDPNQTLDLVRRVAQLAAGAEHCIPIGFDADVEPEVPVPGALRRADGTSVYRMAGGQRYTSAAIVDAERRIVAAAGTGGARSIGVGEVELAGLEWSANHGGAVLNTSQTALVAQVATGQKRVMLALAPAGTGKTTAMGVLARAWQSSGGTVVGLAPQASAAQILGAALGGHGDTLHKLLWDIGEQPGADPDRWAALVGPHTLVIVDEAGLAATPDLDTAIGYITGRGGRVLLVGDDRQRAATGAGGVLRDIESACGAVSLTEVLRFTDPIEAQVSLALRAGDVSAVAFYTDRGRLHPVPADEAADTVYTAWAADTAAGVDSVMIAPTLEQVTDLNARARAARLSAAGGGPVGRELHLSGGETISAGDLILTKSNARGLSLGGTDFVRNNYRWTVQKVHPDGSVTVTLLGRGVTRRLPAWYLRQGKVRLGYAATAASVQGLTVGKTGVRRGTAHVLLAEGMTRNEAYPALTRAADGTHVYVISTRHGDAHDVVRPESLRPATAAETLARIIATDGTAVSAGTAARLAADPARRLGRAAGAYAHAIDTGVATLLGPEKMAQIAAAAEQAVPGVTGAPAFDSLHQHLARLALDGHDPAAALTAAAAGRELVTAKDVAAVLDWRLDPPGELSRLHGPLPSLPAIPARLAQLLEWGTYLKARAALVTDLADDVRVTAAGWDQTAAPDWATPYLTQPALAGDLAVWRAAHAVDETDLRPAGPTPGRIADQRRHRTLTDRALAAGGDPADSADRWATTLRALGTAVTGDEYWPVLAGRLSLAERAGLPVTALLDQAARGRPLPTEQPAAALWWRLAPHLGDLAAPPGAAHRLRPPWTEHITTTLGPALAAAITEDRLWPSIIAKLDAVQRAGVDPAAIAADAAALLAAHIAGLAPYQAAPALLWTITTLTDPAPPDPTDEELIPDPADADLAAPADAHTAQPAPAREVSAETTTPQTPGRPGPGRWAGTVPPPTDHDRPPDLEQLPPDPAQAEQNTAVEPWAAPGYAAAVQRSPDALAAAHAFYTANAPSSWVPGYMVGRGLPADTAGYAPAGWDHLVRHLRALGYTVDELKAAGLARTTARGTVIDVFRDRAVLPIYHPDGHVAAFIGRANPTAAAGEHRPPKYLNSPTTDVFRKSDLPYGLDPDTVAALRAGADLVITEGPIDALAVRVAARTAGRNLVAVAPNGTALTPGQLATLNDIAPLTGRTVIVAMDNDPAGLAAAARAYNLLAAADVTNARAATNWAGKDPAETLATNGPAALADLLNRTRPLADLAIDAVLHRWPTTDGTVESRVNALREAGPIIADMPAPDRARQAARLTEILNLGAFDVIATIDRHLPASGLGLPTPPVLSQTGQAATPPRSRSTSIGAEQPTDPTPQDATRRWRHLFTSRTDVLDDPHWPILAEQIDRLAAAGHDIPSLIERALPTADTTGPHAARDLDFAIADLAYLPAGYLEPANADQAALTAPPVSTIRPPQHRPAPRR